ncbi:hypothetical protein MD484_g8589, partial [Candolleomyces efflorescens]
MPSINSSRHVRHRARVASARRHLRSKEDVDGNRVFAQTVPRFLQMPEAYPQDYDAMSTSAATATTDETDSTTTSSLMVEDCDVTPTPSSMIDDRDTTPTPFDMHIDGPPLVAMDRFIEYPGITPSSQPTAGPSRFPGCLDWTEPSRQKEPSVVYVLNPASYNGLCFALSHLQEASALVQNAISTAEVYHL